ncbi:MAG: WbqC family protein, partial [bacterium]
KYFQKIKEVIIADNKWNKKHWLTLLHSYSKAKYFKEYKEFFEELYLNCKEKFLSEVNYKFIISINKLLGIKTKVRWSSEFYLEEGKNERLIQICKQAGASVYLTGPSAKNYLNENLFKENGIQVEWMDYSGYPEYNQLYPPFEHKVSIIDLIFNEGPNSTKFMKSFKQ